MDELDGGAGQDATQIDRVLDVNGVPAGYVLLQDVPDYETGEVISATLASQGIQCVMQNPMLGPGSNLLPPLGNTWSHAIYVPEADVEDARVLLSSPPPSEEELAAEQAADPTTLEEAENSIRNA